MPNRALFEERLNQSLEAGHGQRLAAVMFLDLDQFKAVNDTLGHSAGDQLLQIVGRRLEGCLRQTDMVSRFGGDEFVISLFDPGRDINVAEVAGKILAVLSQPMELNGERIRSSASIGIALFPQDGKEPEELLMRADAAMYQAKAQGGNGFQFSVR